MVLSVALILIFQLAGVILVQAAGLPVPGPVVGMVLLLAGMVASDRLAGLIRPAGQGILQHLSLLFVPAGVGVVGHLGVFAAHGWGLAVALIASTLLALVAGVLVFRVLSRLTGADDA